jgi:hypothetical protein
VRWRFSAPAGDVEGSKLCLFSVIMPAKCVSSVSPRFHYRRLAFCFLPLATILEFPLFMLLNISSLFGNNPGNISQGSEKRKGRKSIHGFSMNKSPL